MTSKQYEGITLRVLAMPMRYYPLLVACAKEFAKNTGASIEFESPHTWWHLHPTVDADLASGAPRYDIFCNDVEFQYTLRRHLLPLNPYIEQRGVDMADFFTPVKKYGLEPPDEPGVHYGLPIRVRVPLVFYRTDLIGAFPKTWEEYDAALKEHTGHGRFGLGYAGGYNEMMTKMFLARYKSLGGVLLSREGKPRLNDETGIAALAMLKEQAQKYAPPGVSGWDYEYTGQMFREGHLAIVESIGEATLMGIQNPVVSQIVDKWSVGLYPNGGANIFTHHHLVIFKHCPHPDAAFDYIAYCTDRTNARRLLLEHGEDAARKSVWQEPALLAARPHLGPMAEALERGFPFLPWVPQWLEMLRVLWDAVSACLGGRLTPKESLDYAAKEWSRLLAAKPLTFVYRE